jgi:hypothetical protein
MAVYVLALLSGMQIASFQRRIIFSYVFRPAVLHFSPHYLVKGLIFVEKIIEHKMCVLIFSATFV